jgi:MmyB-like transcription regulator ligand binding domain
VHGRVRANALITAITPVVRQGTNLIRATFLEPEIRRRLDDWETVAAINVARLRFMAGPPRQPPAGGVGRRGVRRQP